MIIQKIFDIQGFLVCASVDELKKVGDIINYIKGGIDTIEDITVPTVIISIATLKDWNSQAKLLRDLGENVGPIENYFAEVFNIKFYKVVYPNKTDKKTGNQGPWLRCGHCKRKFRSWIQLYTHWRIYCRRITGTPSIIECHIEQTFEEIQRERREYNV